MTKIEGQSLPDILTVRMGADQLQATARGMAALATLLPVKASFQQGVAFMCMIAAHAKSEALSMSEMMTTYEGAFSPAIRTGYVLFVDDLKWIEQVADASDKRKRVLKMTAAGVAVAVKVLEAMEE